MSQIKVNSIVTVAGANTVEINGTVPTTYNTVGKNRIINGAMVIDQRNAGASVSNANGYTLDRWYFMRGNSSSNPEFTVQQSSSAPAGFVNSLGVTVSTTGAPGANNYSALYQRVEGYNVADLNFGSADASTFTLSFWVKCSVTGIYSVALQNSANDRSYIAGYEVTSANTWQKITIPVTGDTSGTWLTTNGVGIGLYWDMGVGTTQSTSSLGTWVSGNYLGYSSGTKLSNTSGATFYITGVQLEAGPGATSFDFRQYGQELALCQRYYEILVDSGQNYVLYPLSTDFVRNYLPYTVAKRATPTISGGTGTAEGGGSWTVNYVPKQSQWGVSQYLGSSLIRPYVTGLVSASAEL